MQKAIGARPRERLEAFNWGLGCWWGLKEVAFSGGPLFTAIQTQAAPVRGDRKDQRVLQHPRSPITTRPGG